MSELQYEVAKDGSVVSAKVLHDNEPVNLVGRKVEAMPWTPTQWSKWAGLENAILSQAFGEIYVYSGFANEKMLFNARDTISRWKNRPTERFISAGVQIEMYSVNKIGHEIAVRTKKVSA